MKIPPWSLLTIAMLLLVIAPVYGENGDVPTSGTLRLESVFQSVELPERQNIVTWGKRPGSGAPFVFPDRQLFIVQATPTPEPISSADEEWPEDLVDLLDGRPLPSVAPRGHAPGSKPRQFNEPLLKEAGRRIGVGEALAHVQVNNGFRTLRIRLILEPMDSLADPVELLMYPGTGDRFSIPAGRYRAIREIWSLDKESVLRHEFEEQDLQRGWQYELDLTGALEREAQMQLR